MLNNLRTRIILFILGGIIISILLVSIITNITLFKEFDMYMEGEQKNRIEEVIKLARENYILNDGWTKSGIENIKVSPLITNFDIVLRDNKGESILIHKMEGWNMKSHMDLMREMGHSMMDMRNNRPQMMMGNSNYNSNKYKIVINNKVVGELELGYIGPFMISEREIKFTKGINKSIVYASLISIIVAIILGIYFSKVISKPISKITYASNDISRGKLDARINEVYKIIELKELSNSINHLASSLEEQQMLRKRLTSDISHELRTPLTILQSHIEALIDGIWEPTEERLTIFKNEVDRLIKLVEELKYLVDIENHRVTIDTTEFNLSKRLDELIENFRYEFESKNIDIIKNISENIYFKGDRDKISQCIINLLSNALKFTEEGRVIIDAKDKEDNIEIIIEDSGIGIDKEDLPYIFERLYRGDKSRNRKTGGRGIGLSITKKLVEAHHGDIKVESKEGIGTKFIITLPKK